MPEPGRAGRQSFDLSGSEAGSIVASYRGVTRAMSVAGGVVVLLLVSYIGLTLLLHDETAPALDTVAALLTAGLIAAYLLYFNLPTLRAPAARELVFDPDGIELRYAGGETRRLGWSSPGFRLGGGVMEDSARRAHGFLVSDALGRREFRFVVPVPLDAVQALVARASGRGLEETDSSPGRTALGWRVVHFTRFSPGPSLPGSGETPSRPDLAGGTGRS